MRAVPAWLVAGLAALALSVRPVHAATAVGTSVIGTNEQWSLAGSPYVVSGTVSVSLQGSLTIQQGVVVELASNGQIIGASVRCTPAPVTTQDWSFIFCRVGCIPSTERSVVTRSPVRSLLRSRERLAS